MNNKILALALFAALPVACTSPAPESESESGEQAAVEESVTTIDDGTRRPVFTGVDGGNVAIGGYDAVSYFEGDGTPVEGSSEHVISYNGTDYQFASAENAEKFAAEPAKFVPAYGGHCAWAMSNGKLAPGDPTIYKIVDGKLFLNYNKEVQETWLGETADFIAKSEKAWPTIADDAKFGG